MKKGIYFLFVTLFLFSCREPEPESKINVFAAADIFNDIHWANARNFPADYLGGITWVIVYNRYDRLSDIKINIIYRHPDPNDFTGVYHINPNANGLYNPDSYMIQNIYEKSLDSIYWLVSGTLTVTRVDKPWSFKIDVDVVSENGEVIQGSFDGGSVCFYNYDYPNYSGKKYADYYNFPYVIVTH